MASASLYLGLDVGTQVRIPMTVYLEHYVTIVNSLTQDMAPATCTLLIISWHGTYHTSGRPWNSNTETI
jgi:hypothetical protein